MRKFNVIQGAINYNGDLYGPGDVIALEESQIQALQDLGHLGDEIFGEPSDETPIIPEPDPVPVSVVKSRADRTAELEGLAWQTVAKLARDYGLATTAPEGGWDTMIPLIVDYEFTEG